MYGSHSQPLMINVSLGTFASGWILTLVGKPAPPMPTIPASRTASQICSGVYVAGSKPCGRGNGAGVGADADFGLDHHGEAASQHRVRSQGNLLDLARDRRMDRGTDKPLALADLLPGLHDVAFLDGRLGGGPDVLAEEHGQFFHGRSRLNCPVRRQIFALRRMHSSGKRCFLAHGRNHTNPFRILLCFRCCRLITVLTTSIKDGQWRPEQSHTPSGVSYGGATMPFRSQPNTPSEAREHELSAAETRRWPCGLPKAPRPFRAAHMPSAVAPHRNPSHRPTVPCFSLPYAESRRIIIWPRRFSSKNPSGIWNTAVVPNRVILLALAGALALSVGLCRQSCYGRRGADVLLAGE